MWKWIQSFLVTEDVNRWAMLCDVLKIPHDASGGRVRDAISEMRRQRCRKFTVTDGKKYGRCYSFYDHFDVWWFDGTCQEGIVELSMYGIRNVTQQ